MTDTLQSPSSESAAAQTRALLCLYECATDERHVEQMMTLVGSWLSDTDSPHACVTLERHAQAVLDVVAKGMTQDDLGETARARPAATLGASLRDELETAQGLRINDDDWNTFLKRIRQGGAVVMIVNCLGPDLTQPELAVLNGRLEETECWVDLNRCSVAIDEAVATLLMTDMKLTESELRVVKIALLGLSSTQIAKELGRSRETVRSHLKSATGKLSVSGQAELGALVRGLELTVQRTQGRQTGEQVKQPDASGLEFGQIGADNGTPVLFVHCFLHGRHIPKSVAPDLERMGVTVIAPARPGFGGSDWTGTADRGTDLLTRIADELAAFVRERGLGRVDLVGHATGFGIAYVFANRYPEHVGQLFGLDPVPPAHSLSAILEYQGLFRAAALAMSRTPTTFKLMNQLVLKRLSGFRSPHKKMRRHILYPAVEIDRIEPEDSIEAMTLNVQDLIAQDLKGCAAEARAYRNNWADVSADANTKPRCTIYTSADNPFVTLKGSEDFAQRIGADLVVRPSSFPYLSQLPQLLERISFKPMD